MSSLDIESRSFHEALPALVAAHEGEYVVIKGDQVRHFADSYEHALDWAYQEFGLDRFFVGKVAVGQEYAHFTREVGPCRP